MKSLIIIPAYNEEACIEQTVRDILEHAPNFDYIVINDCSKDRTKEICEKNHFHYIDLPVNLGIGGAVQTGYKYACNHGYDYAVQVDGDGQHDPRFLEQMLQVMQEKKTGHADWIPFYYQGRLSVVRTASYRYQILYLADPSADRKNHH